MLIAKQKKEENIAEYLLYMWQIEDMIRANNWDLNLIKQNIIDKFDVSTEVKHEMIHWYEGLIEMMYLEGIKEIGHLQINKNVLSELTDLHLKLLNSPQQTHYISLYYKTLPFIVELRSKSLNKDIPELETCLSALYGFLMLRLQRKEISGETQAVISQISNLLRALSAKFKENKEGKLDVFN